MSFKENLIRGTVVAGVVGLITTMNGITPVLGRDYGNDDVYGTNESVSYDKTFSEKEIINIDDSSYQGLEDLKEDGKEYRAKLSAMGYDAIWGLSGDDSEYIIAKNDGYYGVTDFYGNIIMPFQYEDVENNFGDRLLVKKDGMYGVVKFDGTVVIPFLYDYCFDSDNDDNIIVLGYNIGDRNNGYNQKNNSAIIYIFDKDGNEICKFENVNGYWESVEYYNGALYRRYRHPQESKNNLVIYDMSGNLIFDINNSIPVGEYSNFFLYSHTFSDGKCVINAKSYDGQNYTIGKLFIFDGKEVKELEEYASILEGYERTSSAYYYDDNIIMFNYNENSICEVSMYNLISKKLVKFDYENANSFWYMGSKGIAIKGKYSNERTVFDLQGNKIGEGYVFVAANRKNDFCLVTKDGITYNTNFYGIDIKGGIKESGWLTDKNGKKFKTLASDENGNVYFIDAAGSKEYAYLKADKIIALLECGSAWDESYHVSINGKQYLVRREVCNGIIKNEMDGRYYIYKDGVLDTSCNGLVYDNESKQWYNFKAGVQDTTYTGLVKYAASGKWYYVNKGVLDRTFTGPTLYTPSNTWYYVTKGELSNTFTGLAKAAADGKWYYFVNGKISKVTDLVLYESSNTWYYVKDGAIDFSYTGLVKYSKSGNWYYVVNGKLSSTTTDLVLYTPSNTWYYVNKGKVDFSYTGLVKYIKSGNWYYVNKGKMDSTFTGIVKYSSGKSYYVQAGKVNFGYSGNVTYNGKTYKIVNGVVQ